MSLASAFYKATQRPLAAITKTAKCLKSVFEEASGLTQLHSKGLELGDGGRLVSGGMVVIGGFASLLASAAIVTVVGLQATGVVAAVTTAVQIGESVLGGVASAAVTNRLISRRKISRQEVEAKKKAKSPALNPF